MSISKFIPTAMSYITIDFCVIYILMIFSMSIGVRTCWFRLWKWMLDQELMLHLVMFNACNNVILRLQKYLPFLCFKKWWCSWSSCPNSQLYLELPIANPDLVRCPQYQQRELSTWSKHAMVVNGSTAPTVNLILLFKSCRLHQT